MYLDERAVGDVIQRVFQNVERTLSEEGHGAVLGIATGGQDATGVRVTGVTPDGPAHLAGLRSGDLILEVDGVALDGAPGPHCLDELQAFLQHAEPGDRVAVHFSRNQHDDYTDVILGDAADLPSLVRNEPVLIERWSELELVSLTPGLGRYFGTPDGLLVLRAPADAPVDLRDGDVILRIGRRTPETARHARRILESYQPGESLQVYVMREGEELVLSAPTSWVPPPGEEAVVGGSRGSGKFYPASMLAMEDLDGASAMHRL